VWKKDIAFGAINVASAVQFATGGTLPTVTQPIAMPKPEAKKAKVRAATKKTKRVRAKGR
jgi:hypothetical protein